MDPHSDDLVLSNQENFQTRVATVPCFNELRASASNQTPVVPQTNRDTELRMSHLDNAESTQVVDNAPSGSGSERIFKMTIDFRYLRLDVLCAMPSLLPLTKCTVFRCVEAGVRFPLDLASVFVLGTLPKSLLSVMRRYAPDCVLKHRENPTNQFFRV